MDGYPGKRAVNRIVVSKKGSGLVLRDNVNNRDQNAQFCSRIGCSGRLNSMRGTQVGCSEKAKSSRPSFRSSSSGKEIIGSSSSNCSAVNNARKSSTNPRKKLSSQLETDSSETSSVQDEPEFSELMPPPGKIHGGLHPESVDTDSGNSLSSGEGSSSITTNARSRRNLHARSGLGNRDSLAGSSVSVASRSTSQATAANTSRHGLKNVKCNLVSDVVPSSSSSSPESNLGRRKDMAKKRSLEGESSSSSRGKRSSEPALEMRNQSSNHGVSVSDSRRTRNWAPVRDNSGASVRTRRSTNSNNRTRLSNPGSGNGLAPNDSPIVIGGLSESDRTVDPNVPTLSPQFSVETPSGRPNSYTRPGSSSGSLRRHMPGSPSEVSFARSLISRDNFAHYNMDGIAEVLLALERIEQDEELSHEQLIILETSLLLNGLSFYDQHRDMRLDIDDMSYEELLALEERMGSVSTALTEEALSKCVKTSIYESAPIKDATLSCIENHDDVKCSICQEEYVAGDEIGRLHCQHRYHVVCIQQWLRLKNWCPICKVAADPSSPSSSPL